MEWRLLVFQEAGLATGTVLQYDAVRYWDFLSGAVAIPQEFDITSPFRAIEARRLCEERYAQANGL